MESGWCATRDAWWPRKKRERRSRSHPPRRPPAIHPRPGSPPPSPAVSGGSTRVGIPSRRYGEGAVPLCHWPLLNARLVSCIFPDSSTRRRRCTAMQSGAREPLITRRVCGRVSTKLPYHTHNHIPYYPIVELTTSAQIQSESIARATDVSSLNGRGSSSLALSMGV